VAGLATSKVSSACSVLLVICSTSLGASRRSMLKLVDAIFNIGQEMPCVDRFVVVKCVVADFSEFVSVEISA